ncbi:hypothetical protein AAVH_09362 [Aphelenchoides avenae]|nr:hypothetical protein AAVH_09362 [Aphelenchus avenae]
MLVFTVLATLLCSSLVDALKVPVNTPVALAQCLNMKKPYCNNPAVEINKETEFHPIVKAPGGVSLELAVESNKRLTFPVHADTYKVVWEIRHPDDDKCKWEINSDGEGTVTFREKLQSEEKNKIVCDGSDTNFEINVEGTDIVVSATASKSCTPSSPVKLSACNYARPDSVTIPDWDIWALSVSASKDSNQAARIKLENAFVVYDAPDPTTTTNATVNGNVTTHDPNSTTTTHKPFACNTAEVGLGTMTYALIGVCGLLVVLLVIAVIVAAILSSCLIKLKKKRSTTNEGPRKKEGPEDLNKTATMERNGLRRTVTPETVATVTLNGMQPETAGLETASKRMADEKQVEAAETAQNPAPAEAPGEPKSQDVVNKGPDGTSNQPAADPTNNA